MIAESIKFDKYRLYRRCILFFFNYIVYNEL